MILEMENFNNFEEIKELLSNNFVNLHQLEYEQRKFIVISGDIESINLDEISNMLSVKKINSHVNSYYFCSKEFKDTPTVVKIGDIKIGDGNFVNIAGPCTVEKEVDLIENAEVIKKSGANILRAGAFKPRTTPYNFQGLGREGVTILEGVGKKVDIPIVTEVLNPEDVSWMEKRIDAFQVGTRNMTNTALLKKLGQSKKPVILKRSFSCGVIDWIKAAEFIVSLGNPNVILCERGIQSCETYTRFTLDLSAVAVAKQLTHLPVIVDPSHATGIPSLIPTMSKAAIAAGADGLMIEVHFDPNRMIKPGDSEQALLPKEYETLLKEMKAYIELEGKAYSV